jgi:N-acetyl-alpha-D-glucosaminyl L-malate synthase BshA
MTSVNKLRICLITTSFTEGIINLVNDISAKHEVRLVYITSPVNRREAKRVSRSCRLHPVNYFYKAYSLSELSGFQSIRYIRLFLRMFSEIHHIVKTYRVDLIHAHWAIPSAFLASLLRLSVPLVTTIFGSDILVYGKKLIFKYPVKYALGKSAGIVAVSHDLKQAATQLGIKGTKICVVAEGINMERFRPLDKERARSELQLPEGFVILFVGNLIKLKRVDKLIEVIGNISKDIDCHLLIAGDGPEQRSLEKLVEKLGLSNVIFAGRVGNDRIPLYLSASDVLALYSESEGLPQCVQEAMACGIPVVASKAGGIPEIVQHGINGYLVGDEVELERYLRKLMLTPGTAAVMGANALQFARQNLSSTRAVERIEDLYMSVLEDRK